jgi:hypothetical protein
VAGWASVVAVAKRKLLIHNTHLLNVPKLFSEPLFTKQEQTVWFLF